MLCNYFVELNTFETYIKLRGKAWMIKNIETTFEGFKEPSKAVKGLSPKEEYRLKTPTCQVQACSLLKQRNQFLQVPAMFRRCTGCGCHWGLFDSDFCEPEMSCQAILVTCPSPSRTALAGSLWCKREPGRRIVNDDDAFPLKNLFMPPCMAAFAVFFCPFLLSAFESL